ncbi:MAG: metal-dependent transcriptional regulator [Planctomycetia bacterium]|nr:metal-dependent transcriptional regulator [Planctomycetia bacterium]
MPSLTVENYVKTIYQIVAAQGGSPAATGRIATALGVSPGTVTSMLKTLSESKLVTYMPYEGVQLTTAGSALALRILRRHRLIELFLSRTLDMTWDEVHAEAEHIEHAVSDLLVDRIDARLGFPEADPHGDPIPKADGSLHTPDAHTLTTRTPGEQFRLSRVIDQSPEFLRFLSESGLAVGTAGRVMSNRSEAGVVVIQVGDGEITLGYEAAGKILVTAGG